MDTDETILTLQRSLTFASETTKPILDYSRLELEPPKRPPPFTRGQNAMNLNVIPGAPKNNEKTTLCYTCGDRIP